MIDMIKIVLIMKKVEQLTRIKLPEKLDESIEFDTENYVVTFKYAFNSKEDMDKFLEMVKVLSDVESMVKSLITSLKQKKENEVL